MRGVNLAALRLAAVQNVHRWVRKKRSVAILVGGPGFCEIHQHLRGYRIVTSQSFGRSLPVRCCVYAAIVFPIWYLLGD